MSTEMVPFGKHKGKPVDALLDDRPYLEWLLAQPWAKEKLGNVYNIVINNGAEPTETPEHNAMQIRFLSEEFRLKFLVATHGEKALEFASNRAIEDFKKAVQVIKDEISEQVARRNQAALALHQLRLAEYEEGKRKYEAGELKWSPAKPHEPTMGSLKDVIVSISGLTEIGDYRKTNRLIICSPPTFEEGAVDVKFYVHTGFQPDPWKIKTGEKYDGSYLEKEREFPKCTEKFGFAIEIKPSVGDDYPAVLRQMLRSECKCLLVRTYTGIGATETQFREFFKSQGITVVFEHEVDAVILPAFDREISPEVAS